MQRRQEALARTGLLEVSMRGASMAGWGDYRGALQTTSSHRLYYYFGLVPGTNMDINSFQNQKMFFFVKNHRNWKNNLILSSEARYAGSVIPRQLEPEKSVMKLGTPEIALILLENGADPNLKDPTGFSVLHDAARAGFVDTVQTLVDFEANVNLEDGEGNLPLHLAAMEGHLVVVAYLLGHTSSKVNHRNKKGFTAYELARLYKRLELMQWMDAHCGQQQH